MKWKDFTYEALQLLGEVQVKKVEAKIILEDQHSYVAYRFTML